MGTANWICWPDPSTIKELRLGNRIRIPGLLLKDGIHPKVFIMEYQIEKGDDICAMGSTTNLCYDYQKKKVVKWPLEFVKTIKDYEGLE